MGNFSFLKKTALLAVMILVGVGQAMATYNTKATAITSDPDAGQVYVSKTAVAAPEYSDLAEASTSGTTASHTYYYYAQGLDDYAFVGWYTEITGGTKVSDANPYNATVTATTEGAQATQTLYARFAKATPFYATLHVQPSATNFLVELATGDTIYLGGKFRVGATAEEAMSGALNYVVDKTITVASTDPTATSVDIDFWVYAEAENGYEFMGLQKKSSPTATDPLATATTSSIIAGSKDNTKPFKVTIKATSTDVNNPTVDKVGGYFKYDAANYPTKAYHAYKLIPLWADGTPVDDPNCQVGVVVSKDATTAQSGKLTCDWVSGDIAMSPIQTKDIYLNKKDTFFYTVFARVADATVADAPEFLGFKASLTTTSYTSKEKGPTGYFSTTNTRVALSSSAANMYPGYVGLDGAPKVKVYYAVFKNNRPQEPTGTDGVALDHVTGNEFQQGSATKNVTVDLYFENPIYYAGLGNGSQSVNQQNSAWVKLVDNATGKKVDAVLNIAGTGTFHPASGNIGEPGYTAPTYDGCHAYVQVPYTLTEGSYTIHLPYGLFYTADADGGAKDGRVTAACDIPFTVTAPAPVAIGIADITPSEGYSWKAVKDIEEGDGESLTVTVTYDAPIGQVVSGKTVSLVKTDNNHVFPCEGYSQQQWGTTTTKAVTLLISFGKLPNGNYKLTIPAGIVKGLNGLDSEEKVVHFSIEQSETAEWALKEYESFVATPSNNSTIKILDKVEIAWSKSGYAAPVAIKGNPTFGLVQLVLDPNSPEESPIFNQEPITGVTITPSVVDGKVVLTLDQPLKKAMQVQLSIPADMVYNVADAESKTDQQLAEAGGCTNKALTLNFVLSGAAAPEIVSISSYEFATLYSDKNLIIPEGVDVSYVSHIVGSLAKVNRIKGVIPARTGVILAGAEGEYEFEVEEGTVPAITDNMLKGTTVDAPIGGTLVHYILSLYQGEVGLYWPLGTIEGVGTFTNHAGKAFLEVPAPMAPAGVRGFVLRHYEEEETATGIMDIKVAEMENGKIMMDGQLYIINNGAMYNVQGARVK